MKLTNIYNEFLVESIENLPEILAKGIEANSIEGMRDTLMVFGGIERWETSLPLFAYTLLKKGKTESFEKLLDSMWGWEEAFKYIITLMNGLGNYYMKDKEYTFQTVVLPELENMWSDLIVDGNKYYFDVLATDMKDFFSTDSYNGVDCSLIANEVFTDGYFTEWEDYGTNPDLEDLIMKGYISDETYLKIIRHIRENYEGDIISNFREEFDDYKEEDVLPDHDKDSFYLTRERIDRYLDLEQKYDFVVLLDNTTDGLDEIRDILKWSYNDVYNWKAQNNIIEEYENELYDKLSSKPEDVEIQTWSYIKGKYAPKKVNGYRFDVTSWLEEFVIEYFTNDYYDEGALLESLLAYDYGGLGGLCPSATSGDPYIDDTDEEFIKNYNNTIQDYL